MPFKGNEKLSFIPHGSQNRYFCYRYKHNHYFYDDYKNNDSVRPVLEIRFVGSHFSVQERAGL